MIAAASNRALLSGSVRVSANTRFLLRRLSDGDDAATIPRKLLEVIAGQIQMLHKQLRREMAEPLRKRDLLVSAGTEHLQKLHNVAAGILDVVAEALAHHPDVARPEVVGRRLRPG